LTPSWYGESVGRYENGDTLVVDTIGLSTKTFVDNYRTPHTDKLHVIERFKMIDGGKTLEDLITVEDPGHVHHDMVGGAAVPAGRSAPLGGRRLPPENNFAFFRLQTWRRCRRPKTPDFGAGLDLSTLVVMGRQKRAIQAMRDFNQRADARWLGGPVTPGHDKRVC